MDILYIAIILIMMCGFIKYHMILKDFILNQVEEFGKEKNGNEYILFPIFQEKGLFMECL